MTTNMATMHNRFTCKTGVLNVHFYDDKVNFLLSMHMFSTMINKWSNWEYLQWHHKNVSPTFKWLLNQIWPPIWLPCTTDLHVKQEYKLGIFRSSPVLRKSNMAQFWCLCIFFNHDRSNDTIECVSNYKIVVKFICHQLIQYTKMLTIWILLKVFWSYIIYLTEDWI